MRNSLLLLLALGAGGALRAGGAVDPNWQRAVDEYVAAAKLEIGAFHQQVDAAPTDQAKRYGDAKADLARCDRLVGQLGASDPQHFDGLKVQYERTRAQLAADLSKAQKG
jgi:ABC-type transporter Mla subunit MlaD